MLPPPMQRPHVEELRIQSYGCIQDATLTFTPLHALIGPNDSGKSTVLRALRTLGALFSPPPEARELDVLVRALRAPTPVESARFSLLTERTTWRVEIDKTPTYTWSAGTRDARSPAGWINGPSAEFGICADRPEGASVALQRTTLLRLDPDCLRAPHALIADGQPLRFLDERGTGLPALYDALVVRDLPAYMALNDQLSRLFPSVKSIQLMNPSTGTKAIGVKLVDGAVVPAELMSEGMLYYLAFAILPHLEPTALLLIEEPENGLHPARIAEVMRVLRAISERTQVILATHSPLVINELLPDEVTIVTRDKDRGTKATRMKDTPGFEDRAKVYALGELWLSYANGEDEAPLLEGGPRP